MNYNRFVRARDVVFFVFGFHWKLVLIFCPVESDTSPLVRVTGGMKVLSRKGKENEGSKGGAILLAMVDVFLGGCYAG